MFSPDMLPSRTFLLFFTTKYIDIYFKMHTKLSMQALCKFPHPFLSPPGPADDTAGRNAPQHCFPSLSCFPAGSIRQHFAAEGR